MGIHMIGNSASTDTLGFVCADKTPDTAISHVFTRITDSLKAGQIKNRNMIKLHACSNCWICEGWTEVKFEWTPGISSDRPVNPEEGVYLHLECDGWEPDLMLPDPDKPGTFTSIRMVPPGQVKFYFTLGDEEVVLAQDKPSVEEAEYDDDIKQLDVPHTNILQNIIQKKELISKTIIADMNCQPRPPPKSLKKNARLKTPWDFFKSVFKDYKPDNDKIRAKCFEFDWECSKLPKIIKDDTDRAQIRKYLNGIYKHLREAYKAHAAIAPAGQVFSIGTNVFSEMMQKSNGVLDGKLLKMSDIDLEFVATNAGPKKNNAMIPERQMIRYQSMEVLVRLATTKYFRSGTVKSVPLAVETFFDNEVLPYYNTFDCHKWRTEKLWNEKCDHVYKRYLPAMNKLY